MASRLSLPARISLWLRCSCDSGSPKAASQNELNLIAASFEESPTYLATYRASDRARALCREALLLDTLFSGVYPLQWRNDDQFDSVMDDMIATGF